MGGKQTGRGGHREQKRKKREKAKRLERARRAAAGSSKERMRRTARWPVLECRISSAFRQGQMTQVVIARRGPGAIAIGVFLVDLGCLGVKDCFGNDDLTQAAYERMVAQLEEREPFETCDPALAVKVVQTGVEYAAGLGFRPHPDYGYTREIFGDIDPASCREEVRCGREGRPLYIMGPDDDAEEIMRRLTERLGPDGFDFIAEGEELGQDLVERAYPGEDDPDPDERLWGRMRRAEAHLIDSILKFAVGRYGRGFLRRAWEEFDFRGVLGADEDEDEEEPESDAFVPWLAFSHRPVRKQWLAWRSQGAAPPAALEFLAEQGPDLDPFERRFLETVCRSPYSFHVVETLEPGRRLGLRDLFTGRTTLVRETSASRTVSVGEVIFGRVVALDSVAILVGVGSYVLPAAARIGLIEAREQLAGQDGLMTEEAVLGHDRELRGLYWDFVERTLRPPAAELTNTDGEPLVFCSVHFDLQCSASQALQALRDLAPDWTDEDLREEADFDEAGELERIEFPWISGADRVHKGWDNTVLGHLTIEGGELALAVNSEQRAAHGRAEVERRLGPRARYRTTEKESPDKFFSESVRRKSAGGPGVAGGKPRLVEKDDPRVRAALEQILAAHWAAWPDTALPALNGLTPREAVRRASGRERVEALLDDMVSGRPADPLLRPDVEHLRRELGLPGERRAGGAPG